MKTKYQSNICKINVVLGICNWQRQNTKLEIESKTFYQTKMATMQLNI